MQPLYSSVGALFKHESDVTRTLDRALNEAGLDKKNARRPLRDNCSRNISSEFAEDIQERRMSRVGGRPMHMQTQRKIENSLDMVEWEERMKIDGTGNSSSLLS